MHIPFGPIALLGSGETSLVGGRVFEAFAQRFPSPLRVALLETPAGFELNSPQVAGRVGDFLKTRLQNYDPILDLVPARKRGTPFSPDDSEILHGLLRANIIFMGPGSPTYAVRQLHGSLAWDLVRARHRLGAALVFASAATISVGAYALPVYEIFKVGEDVRTIPGLDLFADFGLSLSFIPHWNNGDGGAELDTSRCFVGMERFAQWCAMLPSDHTVVGLDEHTGLVIDFEAGNCTVNGISSVTLLKDCTPKIYPAGRVFPIEELGDIHCPQTPEAGLPGAAWEMVQNVGNAQGQEEMPAELVHLTEERNQARLRMDWVAADLLRRQIEECGWKIQDSPEGQKMIRQS